LKDVFYWLRSNKERVNPFRGGVGVGEVKGGFSHITPYKYQSSTYLTLGSTLLYKIEEGWVRARIGSFYILSLKRPNVFTPA
jgi:hypothetical protein